MSLLLGLLSLFSLVQEKHNKPTLSPLPGYSLTCCCCTFAPVLNNGCAIKHAGDTESRISLVAGAKKNPALLLPHPPTHTHTHSGLFECDRRNKLPWSAVACKPCVRRYVMCGTCVPENGPPPPTPLLLLWSANMQSPSARRKRGQTPSLGR